MHILHHTEAVRQQLKEVLLVVGETSVDSRLQQVGGVASYYEWLRDIPIDFTRLL